MSTSSSSFVPRRCSTPTMWQARPTGTLDQDPDFSDAGIRYSNLGIQLIEEDVSLKGFGFEWGHTRSYSQSMTSFANVGMGNGWFVKEWPFLCEACPPPEGSSGAGDCSGASSGSGVYGPYLVLMGLVDGEVYFGRRGDGSFQALYGAPETLSKVGDTYVMTDRDGNLWQFRDFSHANAPGLFMRVISAAGVELSATEYSGSRISRVSRSGSPTETIEYTYNAASSVLDKLVVKRDGSVILEMRYHYEVTAHQYAVEPFGQLRLLRKAEAVNSAGEITNRTVYRYNGYIQVNRKDSFALVAELTQRGLDEFQLAYPGVDPETTTQLSLLKPFSRRFHEYDGSIPDARAPSAVYMRGKYKHEFSYGTAGAARNGKTTETLPNGDSRIVFTDRRNGRVLARQSTGTSSNDVWTECYKYDPEGRLLERYMPSACSGYDADSGPILVSGGLVHTWGWNYWFAAKDTLLQYEGMGETGVDQDEKIVVFNTWLREYNYYFHSVDRYVSPTSGPQENVPALLQELGEVIEHDGSSSSRKTSYSYDEWHPNGTWKRATKTFPAIDAAHNGPGGSAVEYLEQDKYGNLTSTQIAFQSYPYPLVQRATDPATGSPIFRRVGPAGGIGDDYWLDELGRVTRREWSATVTVFGGASGRRGELFHYDDLARTRYSVAISSKNAVWPAKLVRFNGDGDILEELEYRGSDDIEEVTTSFSSYEAMVTALETSATSTHSARWSSRTVHRYDALSGERTFSMTCFDRSTIGKDWSSGPVSPTEPGWSVTEYEYDSNGRVKKTTDPSETETEFEYNALDQVTRVKKGVASALETVEEREYSRPGVDMTLRKRFVTSSSGSGGSWNTEFEYNQRNLLQRQTEKNDDVGDTSPEKTEQFGYNNLNEVVSVTFQEGSTLKGSRHPAYDALGRVYYADWLAGTQSIVGRVWRDWDGRALGQVGKGRKASTKYEYDDYGRVIGEYLVAEPPSSWSDARDVSQNKVIEQVEYELNSWGLPTKITTRKRLPTASGVGKLDSSTGLPTFEYRWYDAAGRTVVEANYGSIDGAPTTPPSAISGGVALTVQVYGADGGVREERTTTPGTSSPWGRTTLSEYDARMQVTRVVEDEGGVGKTTEFTYSRTGKVASMVASNDLVSQTTTYEYGVSPSSGVGIRDNDVLGKITYPDGGEVTFQYNLQRMILWKMDQAGTRHEYRYDGQGRTLSDAVDFAPGSKVDSLVREIETRWTAFTGPSEVASLGVGGIALDRVSYEYDDWLSVKKETQSHDGLSGNAAHVEYGYEWIDGSAPVLRPLTMTYPDEKRVVTYSYAKELDDALNRPGAISDKPAHSTATAVATYEYVGAHTFAAVGRPCTVLNLIDEFDRFERPEKIRWSRFGGQSSWDQHDYEYDVLWQVKRRENPLATNSYTKDVDESYAYDRLNRLNSFRRGLGGDAPAPRDEDFTLDQQGNWKLYSASGGYNLATGQTRQVTPANEIAGILESGPPSWFDPKYDDVGNLSQFPRPEAVSSGDAGEYDAWNRLVRVRRVEGSSVGATIAQYRYDGLHRRIVKDGCGCDNTDDRHFYYSTSWQVIEERARPCAGGGSSSGSGSSNGNGGGDGGGSSSPSGAGLGSSGGPPILESSAAASSCSSGSGAGGICPPVNFGPTKAERQFVWGLRDVDELLVRDRALIVQENGDNYLNERMIPLQDLNFNTTVIIDHCCRVIERVVYESHGSPIFLNTEFEDPKRGSKVDFEYLFAGYRYDWCTNLYHVRNRDFHPTLGVWLQRDPIGYADSTNLYQYGLGDPVNQRDPSGLIAPILIAIAAYKVLQWTIIAVAAGSAVESAVEYWIEKARGGDRSFLDIWHRNTAVNTAIGAASLVGAGWLAGAAMKGTKIAALARGTLRVGEFALGSKARTAAHWGVNTARYSSKLLGRSGVDTVADGMFYGENVDEGSFFQALVGNVGGDLLGVALRRAGKFSNGAPRGGIRVGRIGNVEFPAQGPLGYKVGNIQIMGNTSRFGEITIRQGLSPRQFIETLRHERVHQFLSPSRSSLFARSRAGLKLGLYRRSHFLRFTEEALAETIGTRSLVRGLTYPFRTNFLPVSLRRVVGEGAIGLGVVGGLTYGAYEAGNAWAEY